MSLGPLMVDVAGTELDRDDRDLLQMPAVGGVILFDRNYGSPRQLLGLVEAIKSVRQPALLVAIDQEGGRVQRLRKGFTRLPAMARHGEIYARDRASALSGAWTHGWVLATELRSVGIDFSFAPVLDLRSSSSVIGERAFHADPEVVVALARALCRGMREARMTPVGKHFPGHGSVHGDSHHNLPVDGRALDRIQDLDLHVFSRLVSQGVGGVMMGHVLYPQIDDTPACFSRYWIGDQLRGQLNFNGPVFTDDLSMRAADAAGPLPGRAAKALAAGCDMVLVCNDRPMARAVAELGLGAQEPLRAARLARFHARGSLPDRRTLEESTKHLALRRQLESLEPSPELDLGDDGPV